MTLAKLATASPNIYFRGLYAHSGDSYSATGPAELRKSSAENMRKFLKLKERFAK